MPHFLYTTLAMIPRVLLLLVNDSGDHFHHLGNIIDIRQTIQYPLNPKGSVCNVDPGGVRSLLERGLRPGPLDC